MFAFRYIRRKRCTWVKPGRTDQWWQNLESGVAPEEEWKINFRMPRKDFLELVDMIKPHAKKRSNKVRQDIISLKKRVAMTLYYLKDQGSLRMTSNLFGVEKSTLSVVLKEICSIICKNLGPELIKYPVTREEASEATAAFLKRFGFPQVIGCVDGTHVPIKRPSENAQDYFSYKMKYTLNCQAICNHNGQFIDVDIKWPGSVHDARVFANSIIQNKYCENEFHLFYKELIPGEECVPQVLLGDPAYPLLPYCMKEYETCNSNEEVIYNQMLRSARNQIECAFGRLKARWRILMRPIDLKLDFIPKVIYTCFVLHNFCERKKIEIPQDEIDFVISEERSNVPTIDRIYSYHTSEGSKVRNSITQYFKEYL